MLGCTQPCICGGESELGGRVDDGVRLGWASGGLRKRSEAESSAWMKRVVG